MKKITISGLLIFMLILITISACKGKSDDTLQPTSVTVKIFSQGTGTSIGGIDATLVLPSGVTVKATPDIANPAVLVTNTGVVTASGVATGANTIASGTYSAAAGATPGKVVVHVVNPDGFATGEFVTITCDITVGSFPQAADFTVTDFTAVDLYGAQISGPTAALTADIH